MFLALELAYGHRRAYVDRSDNGPVDRTKTDASLVDEGPAPERLSSVDDLLRLPRRQIDLVPGDGIVLSTPKGLTVNKAIKRYRCYT